MLRVDHKRIHALQTMWNSDKNFVAATCEVMGLLVSEKTRRVAEMHEDVYTRLKSMLLKHGCGVYFHDLHMDGSPSCVSRSDQIVHILRGDSFSAHPDTCKLDLGSSFAQL